MVTGEERREGVEMDQPVGAMFAGMGLGMIVLGLILFIAWIIVPFAIIGTKPILREILAELRKQNSLLARTQMIPTLEKTTPGRTSDVQPSSGRRDPSLL